MDKEKLLKELELLEQHSKERCLENGGDWKYNCGIMYAIGWLTSALDIAEDYEKLNDLLEVE